MQVKLAYCDYIAHLIQKGLRLDTENLLDKVHPTKLDLDPVGGWFVSPKKMITVLDTQGKAYVITVEEAPLLDRD